jgi:putative MFS transporter
MTAVTDARTQLAGARLMARMGNVPFSRWHRKPRIVMGSATFFDAFDALSLAFALPVLISLWEISPAQIGILLSASYLGQLIGALLFSSIAERFGRTRGATAAVSLMSLMSLACAFAGNFNALLATRFVQGIGIGGHMPVAAAYINELSQAVGRGRFFMLYEMIFPIGLMATGQIGARVVPALGWEAMFLIGAIPGLVIAALLWRLPESPRWLIARGRLNQAEKIIEQMEASTPRRLDPSLSLDEVSATVPAQDKKTSWLELLSSTFRARTLVVWVLWACAYFIANGLNNWMPTLYNTLYGLNLSDSLLAASMTNVTQVTLLLVCAFTIDRIGRRRWVTASFVLGAVMLTTLGGFAAQSVIAIMILGTLSYGIIGSTNAVLYLYTPEVYPTRIRAIGTGLATSWLRLASAAAPAMVGLIVESRGIETVFLVFAGVAVIGAVAATRMLQTENRRLEDISE